MTRTRRQVRRAEGGEAGRFMRVCGLVLAAGAGTRFGGPKGLARMPDGEPWVARAVRMLRDGGCDDVLVAVGARGDDVAALVPGEAAVVSVPDWADGVSAGLRAGILAAGASRADLLAITPVDTPEAPPEALRRLLAVAEISGGADALVQAVYSGRPGHPVLIGRGHWPDVAGALQGDRGARPYLAAYGVIEVEASDLWSGSDVDER
ncbi:nucleotidyltransferase family protein [Microbacter sp. GSS18]|nr:nucleotidyltransferase family protein [Microbacter sp. GSS18]